MYLAAARHLRRYGDQYDAVVDFQNGIPFFAPWWAPAGTPVLCVVHHVHQAQFDMYFRWPLNVVGRLLEGRVSRRVYRDCPLVAVSPSTRAEMRRQLRLRGPVYIVPNGIDPGAGPRITCRGPGHRRRDQARPAQAAAPAGRGGAGTAGPLARSAGRHRRRRACARGAAGRGARLGLEDLVRLPGRVSEQAKSDLLSRAWLTVAPSLAEGWGLTVLEANAVGTPAVAFDVPGLRDSVRDKVTGWLVPPGQELAERAGRGAGRGQRSGPAAGHGRACRRWAPPVLLGRHARNGWPCRAVGGGPQGQPRPSRRGSGDLATVASWPPGQLDDDRGTPTAEGAAGDRRDHRSEQRAQRPADGLRRGGRGCGAAAGADRARAARAWPPRPRSCAAPAMDGRGDAARSGAEEITAAARGARWITIAIVVVGLLNYGYALLLTRLLDVAAYSRFAAGQGLILWASTVATVSVPWVLAQALARARSEPERNSAVRFAKLVSVRAAVTAAALVAASSRCRFAAPARCWPLADQHLHHLPGHHDHGLAAGHRAHAHPRPCCTSRKTC